jgi:uncharacterized Fe-S cluster protein YjdI
MDIKDITKEYPNDEITIVWQPKKCIHSEKCWRGLGEVFRYGKKPWINPNGAESESIMKQVDQCPSGALSYYKNGEKNTESKQVAMKINVSKNGPILIKGEVEVSHSDGTIKTEKNVALCRCGASGNKPYCDGSHSKVGFNE